MCRSRPERGRRLGWSQDCPAHPTPPPMLTHGWPGPARVGAGGPAAPAQQGAGPSPGVAALLARARRSTLSESSGPELVRVGTAAREPAGCCRVWRASGSRGRGNLLG